MDPWQIVVASVAIVCGLVGVIYWAGQSRDDKQDARAERNEAAFREHDRDDKYAHERLTAVETKVANLETEVRGLRDMRHEIIRHCTDALASWYEKVIEMIAKIK